MNKAEIDLKRDQLVPSGSAVARLQELHQLMNSSLLYTKRLISFMVFEQEGDTNQSQGSGEEQDANSLEEMEESNVKPENEKTHLTTHKSLRRKPNQQKTPEKLAVRKNLGPSFSQTATQIPLDRLVKLHCFELIEVLLMMTIENFKMSGTPITAQLTQTMDLVQEKTDPKRVQEIRRQYLSDGKIHF